MKKTKVVIDKDGNWDFRSPERPLTNPRRRIKAVGPTGPQNPGCGYGGIRCR